MIKIDRELLIQSRLAGGAIKRLGSFPEPSNPQQGMPDHQGVASSVTIVNGEVVSEQTVRF